MFRLRGIEIFAAYILAYVIVYGSNQVTVENHAVQAFPPSMTPSDSVVGEFRDHFY